MESVLRWGRDRNGCAPRVVASAAAVIWLLGFTPGADGQSCTVVPVPAVQGPGGDTPDDTASVGRSSASRVAATAVAAAYVEHVHSGLECAVFKYPGVEIQRAKISVGVETSVQAIVIGNVGGFHCDGLCVFNVLPL